MFRKITYKQNISNTGTVHLIQIGTLSGWMKMNFIHWQQNVSQITSGQIIIIKPKYTQEKVSPLFVAFLGTTLLLTMYLPVGVSPRYPFYGGLDGVNFIDTQLKYPVWNEINEILVDLGYTPGVNLRAAPASKTMHPLLKIDTNNLLFST